MSAEQQSISPYSPSYKHPRRQRACISCKSLKLKCNRGEGNPGDSCERCMTVGRKCIISAPPVSKRARRNIGTVASLESKVDALVAALKERQAGEVEVHGVQNRDDTDLGSNTIFMLPTAPGNSRDEAIDVGRPEPSAKRIQKPTMSTLQAEHQYSFAFFLPRPNFLDQGHMEDVIDKGLISLAEAEECFVRFTEAMLPHFPLVVFPPATTASAVRRTRPILFLAILGAASQYLGDGVRKILMEKVMKTYSDRLIMDGERNMDLLQAIQVSTIWYFPPERFDDVRVYQFIHIATILALELDSVWLGRSGKSGQPLQKDTEFSDISPVNNAPKKLETEYQRALLCCYILCCIAFKITRRSNLLRWTPYMSECLEALEKDSLSLDSDLFLCQWVRCQQIGEEVAQHFFPDHSSATINIGDFSVQYTLRSYEERLDLWKSKIPPTVLTPALESEYNLLNLYLHESFLFDRQSVKECTVPSLNECLLPVKGAGPDTVTTLQYRALSICLESVKNILEIFLSYDIETLCSIPIFYYAQTTYTVFAMMKINFAASRIDNNLHQMVDHDLNVEFYINELLRSLQEVSQKKNRREAGIFHLILLMLRMWFQRRKAQHEPDRVPINRGDTILHTVLRTADAISADGSSKALDAANTAGIFSPEANSGNSLAPADIETWHSEQDEEMLSWNEYEFESFLQKDESMFLQIALERLGGLIG